MEEIWKDCPLDPRYKISNLGRIKGIRTSYLIPYEGKNNHYLYVSLGRRKKYLVHRLVMITFCPIENSDNLQVNHKDGNRQNNCLDNLEWVTASENLIHSYHELNRNPTLDKIHEQNKKKIYSLNIDTKEIIYFDSQTECANYYSCDKSNLTKYIDTEKVWSKHNIVLRRQEHNDNFIPIY